MCVRERLWDWPHSPNWPKNQIFQPWHPESGIRGMHHRSCQVTFTLGLFHFEDLKHLKIIFFRIGIPIFTDNFLSKRRPSFSYSLMVERWALHEKKKLPISVSVTHKDELHRVFALWVTPCCVQSEYYLKCCFNKFQTYNEVLTLKTHVDFVNFISIYY